MGDKKYDDGITKAERKALEEREAQLIAELEARATKSKSKPKGKVKSKAKKSAIPEPDLSSLKRKALKVLIKDKTNGKTLRGLAKAELARRDVAPIEGAPELDDVLPPEGDVPAKPKGKGAKGKVIDAAERVLAEPSSPEATVAAETALEAATEASDDETDEQIKARVKAKREARAAEGVKAKSGKPIANDAPGSARGKDALEGESEVDYQWRKAREKDAPKVVTITEDMERDGVKPGDIVDGAIAQAPALTDAESKPRQVKAKSKATADAAELPPAQVVEPVETETGTIYEDGAAESVDEFAKPSEAPHDAQLEEGRNGYKIIALREDGTPDFKRDGTPKTVRQFTRVTTYIDNLEDKRNLEQWKMRTLLEGVALADTPDDKGRIAEPVVAKVRDLMHVRDVALGKIEKADRKGKLEVGERAEREHAAVKAFKDAINVLADELLELGGVHEKANRGTNLHALTEIYDAEGIAPIDAKLEAGAITPTDHASVVAYGQAVEKAGLKIIASEVVVVNDALKYAGRFDRIVLAKRPGDMRARKVIADIKTGRIDYGLVKIEQQLAMYADADEYNLETGVRTKHGADKTWGLLIHLPQGEGTCAIHVLDLTRGRRGNALSRQVREWRTEAGRVKLSDDLANPAPPSEQGAESLADEPAGE